MMRRASVGSVRSLPGIRRQPSDGHHDGRLVGGQAAGEGAGDKHWSKLRTGFTSNVSGLIDAERMLARAFTKADTPSFPEEPLPPSRAGTRSFASRPSTMHGARSATLQRLPLQKHSADSQRTPLHSRQSTGNLDDAIESEDGDHHPAAVGDDDDEDGLHRAPPGYGGAHRDNEGQEIIVRDLVADWRQRYGREEGAFVSLATYKEHKMRQVRNELDASSRAR